MGLASLCWRELPMYCKQCGQKAPDGSTYCGKCGTRLQSFQTAVSSGTEPDDRKSGEPLQGRRNIKVSLAGRDAGILLCVVAVGAGILLWLAITGPEPKAQSESKLKATSPAAAPMASAPSERKTAAPTQEGAELDATKILLNNRAILDKILGKPKAGRIADCTKGEQGFSYQDDSYVCVGGGKVTLLSYHVKTNLNGGPQALSELGIRPDRPSRNFGLFERWSTETGNELTLNGKTIPNL